MIAGQIGFGVGVPGQGHLPYASDGGEAGAPGVSTELFGSLGLYVASGCLSAFVTSPVVGFNTETFGWSNGPVGYSQYESVPPWLGS